MPVVSTKVTLAWSPSSFATRLAATVPPTPPPRISTSFVIVSSHLANDEVREALVLADLHQLLLGLGHPGRDVGPGAGVARKHVEHLPDLALPDRADEVHEWAGAGHAPGVDRLFNLYRAHRHLQGIQMNTTWPSDAEAMNAATPSTPATSGSRAACFRWNRSMESAQAWMFTSPTSFACLNRSLQCWPGWARITGA